MEILKILNDIINDYTIRTVTIGAAVLGIISGGVGSFAVLRKQSLLGDTISHAALPGIALAFIFTGFKSQILFVLGALIAGLIGTAFFSSIITRSKIKSDTAMGIILSSFFGFGIVLLTYIQKKPTASQAGIEKYLFGQAAAIVEKDLIIMGIFGLISLITVFLLWKEFKICTFDPGFAHTTGTKVKALNSVLTGIIVAAIVIGLQTVGVVLMSAMIALPGAAARQWTNRLGIMLVLAVFFGMISGVCGALISAYSSNLPTGPVIIIVISAIVIISIFFAPKRGIMYSWYNSYIAKSKFKLENVLIILYELSKQHKKNVSHKHSVNTIFAINHEKGVVRKSLKILKSKGLVIDNGQDEWCLTKPGFSRAMKLSENINKVIEK